MATLLTLPVIDDADNVALDDVAALLQELLGPDFEDTVITDSGATVYVAESTATKTVNR